MTRLVRLRESRTPLSNVSLWGVSGRFTFKASARGLVCFCPGIYLYPLTTVGGDRQARYFRRGRSETVCAHGSDLTTSRAPQLRR